MYTKGRDSARTDEKVTN